MITEWKPKSPFGFAKSDEGSVFLHITNFVERARWPEVGDHVTFVDGVDEEGRPCAKKIVLVASGSVLRGRHLLELGLLIAIPAYSLTVAFRDLLSPWWILYFVSFSSLAAAGQLWFDKRASMADRARIPEASIHLFELMGGWPGSFVAQRLLRHKVSKKSYQFVFWAIVLVHELFALDLMFGGFLYRGLRSIAGD